MFQTKDYSFELPSELIADRPLQKRDDSRLLVFDRKTETILHRRFSDLPTLLTADYEIVANNTRVIRARLLGERVGTGGKVEFFLLKKLQPLTWTGLMKSGATIRPGFEFMVGGIHGKVIQREETNAGAIFTAQFSHDPLFCKASEVPLPPYIQNRLLERKEALDLSSEKTLSEYNTLFAKEEGSVAAPTAGRHFTPELIAKLKSNGNHWHEITLHVGLGTFKPVTVEDLRQHTMHPETATVSKQVADDLNHAKKTKKILAVGTTTTRTLEGFSKNGVLKSGTEDLNLFIYPGSKHEWNFVDAMITNFHLPESTLLMMIASFIGSREKTLEIYHKAIEQQYRFYSYGDAMLIL